MTLCLLHDKQCLSLTDSNRTARLPAAWPCHAVMTSHSLMSMTYWPETGTRKRTRIWYVCHAIWYQFLVPESGTIFWSVCHGHNGRLVVHVSCWLLGTCGRRLSMCKTARFSENPPGRKRGRVRETRTLGPWFNITVAGDFCDDTQVVRLTEMWFLQWYKMRSQPGWFSKIKEASCLS